MKIGLTYQTTDEFYSVDLDRTAIEVLMDKLEKEITSAAQGKRYDDLSTALDAWYKLDVMLHPDKELLTE